MVKFGRHWRASRVAGWLDHYADYDKLKQLCRGPGDGPGDDEHPKRAAISAATGDDVDDEVEHAAIAAFVAAWREETRRVATFYAREAADVYRGIYERSPKKRGLDVLRCLNELSRLEVQEVAYLAKLQQRLEALQTFARLNVEALRKAVKKHDKQHDGTALSCLLLPELCVERFFHDEVVVGLLSRLQRRGTPLRGPPTAATSSIMSQASSEHNIKQELLTVQTLLRTATPRHVASRLVLNRGLHSADDTTLVRPLENSLPAYEQAWASGAVYCECDVALTRDHMLVLIHDDDMKRLALFPNSKTATLPISSLDFKDLVCTFLKNGLRPPLLYDVLRSAQNLGPQAQLVIEIKPSSSNVADALVQFFTNHPDLLDNVGVIMSHDLYAIHQFNQRFRHLLALRDMLNAARATKGASGAAGAAVARGGGALAAAAAAGAAGATAAATAATAAGEGGDGAAAFVNEDPKIMLMTVDAPRPKKPVFLYLDWNKPDQIDSWLDRDGSTLDGVYLQYIPELVDRTSATGGGQGAGGAREEEEKAQGPGAAATITAAASSSSCSSSSSLSVAAGAPGALADEEDKKEAEATATGAREAKEAKAASLQQAFRDLCARHTVGVWHKNRDDGHQPDEVATAAALVEAGAKFVNTDLPRTFFPTDGRLRRDISATTPAGTLTESAAADSLVSADGRHMGGPVTSEDSSV